LISASYLVAATSWRWFYWVLTIFCAVGIVLGFFLLTETKYERSPTSLNGQVIATDEWGVTHIVSDAEARERFGHLQDATDGVIPEKKRYIQTLNPVAAGVAKNPLRVAVSANVKMIQALSSPAVIWAILASSIALGGGIAISLTYSTVLTTKFHWSEASVGLVNVGIFPASIAATLYAGFIGDKMNIWLAKRRGGVHTPEDSLVQLIIPFFVGIIGLVIYAVTAMYPESHSAWGVIMGKYISSLALPFHANKLIGWTLYEWAFIVVLIVSTHFGSEAFPSNPGPALVVVIGLKNIISFGCSFGIVPMVNEYSYLKAYMIVSQAIQGYIIHTLIVIVARFLRWHLPDRYSCLLHQPKMACENEPQVIGPLVLVDSCIVMSYDCLQPRAVTMAISVFIVLSDAEPLRATVVLFRVSNELPATSPGEMSGSVS